MVCDLFDVRCLIVNELIGNAILAVLLAIVAYFIIASKLRLGFETTLLLSVPVLIGVGMMVTGFSAIYAFLAFLAGILLAILFSRLIGNR